MPYLRPPRQLKKVIHRKPVPHMPHKHVPEYLLCYVIETLECGHTVITYPQTDALVAVRRDCKDCGSNVIEFPSAGKKSQRVREPVPGQEKEKKAA